MSVKGQPQKTKTEAHRCKECVNVTEVRDFSTLSLKGEPTLGTCPFWLKSKCVLLSQRACKENFRLKS